MGSMRKVIIGLLVLVFGVLLISSYISVYKLWEQKNYCKKIISALDNAEIITVGDVFSFEFDRAYILNDAYMSGEAFENQYNLGLSIKEVKNGDTDWVQRIVFVDKDGFFVYEFQCHREVLRIYEQGMVIYPETLIKEYISDQEGAPAVFFDSSERYGSIYAYLDLL